MFLPCFYLVFSASTGHARQGLQRLRVEEMLVKGRRNVG